MFKVDKNTAGVDVGARGKRGPLVKGIQKEEIEKFKKIQKKKLKDKTDIEKVGEKEKTKKKNPHMYICCI